VRAPFVLLPSYAAAWQQHSLLPSAGARHVLPLGERAVLTASLRAEGDITVRAMQLDAAPGWTSRDMLTASTSHALSAGDVCTHAFELTPTQAAPESTPGAVVVHWETAAAASLGLPPLLSRLPLAPVAVEAPPLSVSTRLPAAVVLGVPFAVCTRVHNRTPLAQELAVAVSDAPGFVFAGERTSALEVLPHSTVELRHMLVAHVAGWQQLPEVAVSAPRYTARLAAVSGRDGVCVRPPARGA
jgi:hypothetical protein